MNTLSRNTLARLAFFQLLVGVLLFLPAWTLHFWQAWLFWAVFTAAQLTITLYFLRTDPQLIQNRLKASPRLFLDASLRSFSFRHPGRAPARRRALPPRESPGLRRLLRKSPLPSDSVHLVAPSSVVNRFAVEVSPNPRRTLTVLNLRVAAC